MNAPLLSRCKVFRMSLLGAPGCAPDAPRALLARGPDGAFTAEDELDAIAAPAQGDARRALTTLEIAAGEADRSGRTVITRDLIAEVGEQKTLLYDKSGEEHYNVVSAFIKSMRGSDPDGTIYWLMRMVEAGGRSALPPAAHDDLRQGEDVGNADPRAGSRWPGSPPTPPSVAWGCRRGCSRWRRPRCTWPPRPKSNACNLAWHAAQAAVREHGALPVPLKLRNAVTQLMKGEGYGEGYRYAHSEEGGVAAGETYLPDEVAGARFYEPTDQARR